MPDFFVYPCGRADAYCQYPAIRSCRSSTRTGHFWIIDDNAESDEPTFIQEYAPVYEAVTVKKESNGNYEVNFKAIDKCVVFPTPLQGIGNNICDGMLYFDNWLIFVELKGNNQPDYAMTGKDQLSRTIAVFVNSHPAFMATKAVRQAYICNSDKPKAPSFSQTEIDKFEFNNHGFELVRAITILIP